MVRRTVKCTGCGSVRDARDKDGQVVPFRDSCPKCGSKGFEDLVDGR